MMGTPGTEEYGSSGGIRVNKHYSLFATIQLNMGPVEACRLKAAADVTKRSWERMDGP